MISKGFGPIKSVVPIAKPILVDGDGAQSVVSHKISPSNSAASIVAGNSDKITDLETVHVLPDIPLIGNPTPNPLDKYDLATYHLKLFMSNPENLTDELDVLPSPRIVLAETGVTDIAFTNLTFETVMPRTKATFNTTYTEIKFTLFEPNGCTLLDRIAEQAAMHNIKNFLRCPYWLEISFRARDPKSGAPVTQLESSEGGNTLRRIIPIRILSNKIQIHHSGTEYQIVAVKYHDISTADETAVLKEPLNISGSTAGEVFSKMSAELSKRSSILKQGNGEFKDDENKPDIIEITLSSEFIEGEDSLVSSSPMLEQPAGTTPFEAGCNPNEITVQFSNGTGVERSIDAVMVATKYIRDNVNTENNSDENRNHEDITPKAFYTIQSTAEIIGFDPNRQDYAHKFTYTIYKTDVSNVMNTKEANSTGDVSSTRSSGILGVLLKQYDYLFSLNKDVLGFDCTLDASWYVEIPRQSGQITSSPYNVGAARSALNDVAIKTESAKLANASRIMSCTAASPPPNTQVETIAGKPTGEVSGEFTIATKAGPLGNVNNSGVEIPNTMHESFVAGLFKREVSGAGANLLEVDLEIRGDPDWIDVSTRYLPYFKFTMGLPREADSEGLIRSKHKNMITGYYKALLVKSTFENGKFTQSIKAIREVGTNLTRILESEE